MGADMTVISFTFYWIFRTIFLAGFLCVAMKHARQWINIIRRVIAHQRAFLSTEQSGECRGSEQALLAK